MDKELALAIQELRNSVDRLTEIQQKISAQNEKMIKVNDSLDSEMSFLKHSINDLVTVMKNR